jgi:hypothetical protein
MRPGKPRRVTTHEGILGATKAKRYWRSSQVIARPAADQRLALRGRSGLADLRLPRGLTLRALFERSRRRGQAKRRDQCVAVFLGDESVFIAMAAVEP